MDLEGTFMPRRCIQVLSFGHRGTRRGPQAGWTGEERKVQVVNSEARRREKRLSLKDSSEMEATQLKWGKGDGEEAGVSGPVAVPFPCQEAQQRIQDLGVVGNIMSAVLAMILPQKLNLGAQSQIK